MPNFQINHNANLPNTLPKSTPIVNFIHRYDNGEYSGYSEKNAPSKLFVKIDNNIIRYGLSLKQLEFYCQLMYLIISYPEVKLSILKIQSLIIQYTGKKRDKNTINTYLKTLLSKGLLYRSSTFLIAPIVRDSVELSVQAIPELNPEQMSFGSATKNQFHAPMKCYTEFYITAYNDDTAVGVLALELYFALKVYNHHRPSLVCKELNISRKTYYKYLKELTKKNIVLKIKVRHRMNHYKNTNRIKLADEADNIRISREMDRDWDYKEKRRKRLELKKNKTAHSRLWYGSEMGKYMEDYKINYIPYFDNIPIDVAIKITKAIIKQYGKNITPALIVSALKNDYNWIKIVDREHAQLKRDQVRQSNYYNSEKGFLELMMS